MNWLQLTRRGAGCLLALALITACEGDNVWTGLPTGGGGSDDALPTVEFEIPDTTRRVAVGDSVLVEVRVSDNRGLESLSLSGFALRGSEVLGTQTRIQRFQEKQVVFDSIGAPVQDTVITRYLLATEDTLPDDSVFLIAVAFDVDGNANADTVAISIGGPRVQIVAPRTGTDVRAGTILPVHLSASDPVNRIERLTVRASGGFEQEITLRIDPTMPVVDTIVPLPIPGSAAGEMQLVALARSASNDSALSATLDLRLLPPIQDALPPAVSFTVTAPERAELRDSVVVAVTATDSTQVGRVGITVLPIHRLGSGTDTLTTLSMDSVGDERTFRFALDQLGVPDPTDTSTVRIEVTAFAVDTAGNCATATIPDTPLSEQCHAEGSATFSSRSGARSEVLVVRGTTIRLESPTDRIADLASNGSQVFLSNIGRNRLDVIRVGETFISGSVSVGSRPWGLAFNQDRSRLYVANSGGTNISVVSPGALAETDRILTPNVKLFDVAYEAKLVANPADTTGADSISRLFPSSVTRYDYSDRPQYIGVTNNENLIYSTLPTGAAPDGTIRFYRTDDDRLEIVTDYLEDRPGTKLIIANADSAFLVAAEPNNLIQICPRNRSADPSLDGQLGEVCFTGPIDVVQDTLAILGYDTKFLYNRNIEEVGLSDTTFVAVSGDHSTVAFGEGGRDNARVMVFADEDDEASPLLKHGEIRDIVGNTAERVIGLGLNSDGSLGIARGDQAYYFSRDLRLQGVVVTGSPTGGVDMHPSNPSPQRSFVSGVEENGLAYIDVIDTFHFRRVGRIFMRDPVTGPIRAVRTASGTLKIYAVTDKGVVAIDVIEADL